MAQVAKTSAFNESMIVTGRLVLHRPIHWLQNGSQAKGLGFGLAIVRRICELLDYPLDLRSVVGKGSVFGIHIPVGSEALIESTEQEIDAQSWNRTGQHILVIDDDRDILAAMEILLSQWQYKVTMAVSLVESIDCLESSGLIPDLILSDLSLRGQSNGLDVIDQLRERFGRNIPCAIISGTTNSEHLQQVEKSGLRLVQKPVRPMELRSVIHYHLVAAKDQGKATSA